MERTNATLTWRRDLSAAVARFRVRADEPPPFRAGQYLALGLSVAGRPLQRPYSTASREGSRDDLEFLIRLVPGGALTTRLWATPVGTRLWLGRRKGLFTLLPGDRRTHLFVASGTGLAPFVSMLATMLDTRRPPLVTLVHGASYVAELGYRQRLERWAASGARLSYIPTISRPAEPANAAWTGRTGRVGAVLEQLCAEPSFDPEGTVAYLCGNPEVIATGERILVARGLPQAAIRSEHYWPSATSVAAA